MPTSRIRAVLLLMFLIVVGLSMTAGLCNSRDTPTVTPPTITPRPTVPTTVPTRPPPTEESTSIPRPTEEGISVPRLPTAAPTSTPIAEVPVVPEREPEAMEHTTTQATTTVITTVRHSTDPRDVSRIRLVDLYAASAAYDDLTEPPTVEELLEKGAFAAEASPVHISFLGTPDSESVRCDWRGVALTLEQREAHSRFWLGIDSTPALPDPAELERIFLSLLEGVAGPVRERMRAGLVHLARCGVSTDHFRLACYADYSPSEYLLGAGPAKVTVLYPLPDIGLSYDLYQTVHESGDWEFRNSPLLSREDYQESEIDQPILDAEAAMTSHIVGRSSVVFLLPAAANSNIAIEAWEVASQWDLQTEGGETFAVRYSTYEEHPEYRQTLSNLKSRIAAAAGSDAFAGQRVTNVSGLTQLYQDLGAYDDITPGGTDPSVFTPAPPLPVQICDASTALGSSSSFGLARDCTTLLDSKDALAGTATLNWSKNTAIASWTGVTLGDTPQRVTGLDISSESLTGAIHPGLGRLHGLTTLDLSSNSLTGAIPASLGELSDLSTLRLSGNAFSGCIPAAPERCGDKRPGERRAFLLRHADAAARS